MAREVAENHFRTGVWAATGPLRLRHYTCNGCGTRLKTWAAFRAHRPLCSGELGRRGRLTAAGAWGADLLDLLVLARVEESLESEAAEAALDSLGGPALDPGCGPALDAEGTDARHPAPAARS